MALPSVKLRAATADDAGTIVALVRAGFSPQLVEAFIYGCHGIERYVRTLIDDRASGVDTSYTVAEAEGRVVGCIEMRSMADALCLNYVAVDAAFRSGKLGSRLLAAAIERDRGPEHRMLTLDVLEHNTVARRWYDGLGMTHRSTTAWHTCPVPAADASLARTARLIGLPQARLVHEALGFSQLRVACPDRGYDIGMLGDKWFRTTSVEALADPVLAAALRRLSPQRELLALVPAEAPLPSGLVATRLTTTLRLSGDLDDIGARLEAAVRT